MEHYSNDTLEGLDAGVQKLRSSPGLNQKVDFYAINLSFDQLREPSEAEFLMRLPTTFFLQPQVVDALKSAARTLLYQNPDFKKLQLDLGASSHRQIS